MTQSTHPKLPSLAAGEPSGSPETIRANHDSHVAVLLCTYNGERFLREQLDSIQAQSHSDWKVWVSDDGSKDATLEVLNEYRGRWGDDRLEIKLGPSRGFAANFLSLVCRPEIQADYYSYADQDDIWVQDKLERAVRQLQALRTDAPALYCSRTELVDEAGASLGLSPLFTQKPDFRNALVQNVGGGNTMVFNDEGRRLLLAAGPDLDVVAHDWWTYLAVTAMGGQVVYDSVPSLRYRQHESNLIGSNRGWRANLHRVNRLLHGQLRNWIDANAVGLRRLLDQLPEGQRQVFLDFDASRQTGVVGRLAGLNRSGVYRQTRISNIGLKVAAILKKL